MNDPAPNTCAVLFEGAGGSTEGLRNAGYQTIGYEFWATAVETAIANGHASNLHDLSNPALDHLIEPAEVMWSSSPCGPFSRFGEGRGEADERDGFPWALRLMARMLPKVAFFENVKGITIPNFSEYFGGILATMRALGYDVEWKVLNCADFGVPQTRERCIIIARRDGGAITWPTPTHTEQPGMFTHQWVSVVDALPYLPPHLEIGYWRGDGMTERFGERPFSPVTLPAPTVHGRSEHNWFLTAGRELAGVRGGNWAVGRQPIVRGATDTKVRFTIAELARLQDFPDGYVFTGSKTAQAQLVGNAVPPRLAQVVAEVNRPR